MKLLWTGNIPWWAAVALFIAMAAASFWSYRRQPVGKPWSIILPSLRCAAGLLLILALMRPVLTEESIRTIRGRIPVIIDNSGSMSVADQYNDHELIRIAWHMNMFPNKVRNSTFENQGAKFTESTLKLDAVDKTAKALLGTGNNPDSKIAEKRAGQLHDRLEAAHGALIETLENIDKSINSYSYLEKDNGNGPAAKKHFHAAFEKWKEQPSGWQKKLKEWYGAIGERIEKKEWPKAAEKAAEIHQNAQKWTKELPEMSRSFQELQKQADTALAAAGIEEVDKAAKKLKNEKRWSLAQTVLNRPPHNLLDRLEEKGEVHIFGLQEPVEAMRRQDITNMTPSLASTRLASVIHETLRHFEQEPVAGVVVVSDGNNNAGATLESAGKLAKERRIPILLAGTGLERPQNDVVIESVNVPDTSFKDDRLDLDVVLRRHGYQDKPLKLKVTRAGRTLRELTVEPGDETRTTVDASFVENEHGSLAYRVEIEPQDNELLERNNSRDFQVMVLEDRIKTLLIDQYPRWESRYVRMMLSRDKRVKLKTIFIGSQEKEMLRTDDGMYPASQKELFAYQLVFLGDVNPDNFSREQLSDLRDFVVERGGTLMVMAGNLYMPEAYFGTPLIELFPFHSKPSAAGTRETKPVGSRNIKLKPAYEGRHDNLLQIGRTPAQSEQLWENLPGMNWVNDKVATSPATDRLVATENGHPVMVKTYAGAGKVLYVGSDSFWRWRDRARWRYHHRFWGQIVLWAATGRTTGSDKHVKLMSNRLRYAPGEIVRIKTRLLDDEEVPIEQAQATISVLNEKDEVVRKTALLPVKGAPGEYRAEIHGLPRGHFRVKPEVFELREKDIKTEINFEIGDLAVGEYVHLSLNKDKMKKWADHYADVYQPGTLVHALEPVSIEEKTRADFEIWNTFYFMILVILLLGAEWQLRKRARLA